MGKYSYEQSKQNKRKECVCYWHTETVIKTFATREAVRNIDQKLRYF